MALEFRENDELVIQAELPTVDPDRDIEVWISHDVLHIRARAEVEVEDHYRQSDLRSGSFARDIALPTGTGEDRVRATYADGRLEVRAPLHGRAASVARRIPVDRAWHAPAAVDLAGRTPRGPRRSGRDGAETVPGAPEGDLDA